jgi:hypothetical protein
MAGILTGSGLQAPVVQYNQMQILHIYLFTIPVEDVFYGLELFLLNLFIYQLLIPKEMKRKTRRKVVKINEA